LLSIITMRSHFRWPISTNS